MDFEYDVFLSCCTADRPIAARLADRLEAEGLRVWSDEWMIGPDEDEDFVEYGLDESATMVLCVSEQALGAEWKALEAQTYRFRDPQDRSRRLIILRLDDDVRLEGGLEGALMVDWGAGGPTELSLLVAACRPAEDAMRVWPTSVLALTDGHTGTVQAAAVRGRWVLSGGEDQTVRLWDLQASTSRVALGGHGASVSAVAFDGDGTRGLSGDEIGEVRVWDFSRSRCAATLSGHGDAITAIVFAESEQTVVSGDENGLLRVWDLPSQACIATIEGHDGSVTALAVTSDGQGLVSVGDDGSVRVSDLASGSCETLEGHVGAVRSLCLASDHLAVTGGADGTIRKWDLREGSGQVIFESAHRAAIELVSCHPESGAVTSVTRDGQLVTLEADGRPPATRHMDGGHLTEKALALDVVADRVLVARNGGDIRLFSARSGGWCPPLLSDVATEREVAFDVEVVRAVTATDEGVLQVWDAQRSGLLQVVEPSSPLSALAVAPGGGMAIGGAADGTLVLFDLAGGEAPTVLGRGGPVRAVAFDAHGRVAASVSSPDEIRIWDLETGALRLQLGPNLLVTAVAVDPAGTQVLVGSRDGTLFLHNLESRETMVVHGHVEAVSSVAFSPDGLRALTGSEDLTICLWDFAAGECLWVLEGHSGPVTSVAFHPSADRAASAEDDGEVRVWDLETGACERILRSGAHDLQQVSFDPAGETITAIGGSGLLVSWPASSASESPVEEQVSYTNAKVVLVGESQAGKSGLALRLAEHRWEHTESTLGAWATQLQLPMDDGTGRREVWLWDFGGQADQRLIHQLYLEDAAVAVLVFDGQHEDVLARLWDWHRALSASGRDYPKLLVAGRVDRNRVRLSREEISEFCDAVGYDRYLETSAKDDVGCDELRSAIVEAIDWNRLPWRTSPAVFQLLKEQILRLKDTGRTLTSTKELRDWLPTQIGAFESRELEAVIGLLAGPGAVMPLGFGDYILLQPELINTYAQAVIETLRDDQLKRGCVAEERVLNGDLKYPSDFQRLPEADEQIVLRAMHRGLVERSLCLRDADPDLHRATVLVFPSYFQRQRPDRPRTPTAFMAYRFQGQLDEIYASLVVRLHHTDVLRSGDLWRDAADFHTADGKTIGLRLTRLPDGDGEIELHCDADTAMNDQVVFARYVDAHLRAGARNLTRLRTYICPNCSTPVQNRETALRRLQAGKDDIGCAWCDERIPLLDAIEEHLGDPAMLARIERMRESADASLHSESKELILVAEVLAYARKADQIARDKPVSDYGIDVEIEFRDDEGEPSGRMVYLQVKSGDSHLRRVKDGRRFFRIKKPRHAKYWADQAFPVMLVVRDGKGKIEWMEIGEPLRRRRERDPDLVRELLFEGQEFDLMAIRRWREHVLHGTPLSP